MGADGVNPLLEALEHAESASRRRWLLRRLEEYGAVAGSARCGASPRQAMVRAAEPARDSSPRCRRCPGTFHPDEYTSHEDGRVRREAYKLLFANPEWRPAAIVRAAADVDMTIVRLALSAALEQFPQDLPPRLLDHLSSRYKDQDIRAAGDPTAGKAARRREGASG